MLLSYFRYNQSRNCLKLYSCKLKWPQNPIIQSHFSGDSPPEKGVFCWGGGDSPWCTGEHRDPVKPHRARDTQNKAGLAEVLRGQVTGVGTPRTKCGAQHGILPLEIHILKTKHCFRLHIQNAFPVFQSLMCIGIHYLK